MQSVESAMHSGYYDRLKRSMKELDRIMMQQTSKHYNLQPKHQSRSDRRQRSVEVCRPLRKVTEIRDRYVTTLCDLCEQMRRTYALFSQTWTSMGTILIACEMRSTCYTSTRLKRKTTKMSSEASIFANTALPKYVAIRKWHTVSTTS